MIVIGAAQVVVQVNVAANAALAGNPTEAVTGTLPLTAIVIVVAYAIYPPMLAVLYAVVVPAAAGRRLTLGQAWAAARPHVGRVYGVYLVLVAAGVVVIGVAIGLAVLLGSLGGAGIAIAVLLVIAAYAWRTGRRGGRDAVEVSASGRSGGEDPVGDAFDGPAGQFAK